MLKIMVIKLILKVMFNFYVKLFIVQKLLHDYMQVFFNPIIENTSIIWKIRTY